MSFCSLACPAHPWPLPTALARRRRRAFLELTLKARRYAGAVLDDTEQTLEEQQSPEAPGTSAGPSTTQQQPHTSPTEQLSRTTATLMPPASVMAQTPVLAQPLPALAVHAQPPRMATSAATSTATSSTAPISTAQPLPALAVHAQQPLMATSTATSSTASSYPRELSPTATSTAPISTAPISTATSTSTASSTAPISTANSTEITSTATSGATVMAQLVRTVVAQPLAPSPAHRPLGPPSPQPAPPELMMPSMSPFYPSTTDTGAAPTSGNASSQSIQSIFMTRVMCDFTPRRPFALPTWKWATLEQLLDRLQLHVPREVVPQLVPNTLRQYITEWYKDHPAFAGLPFTAWGKRLKDMDPAAHPRSLVFKFSFEYTPAEQSLPLYSPAPRPSGGPGSRAMYFGQ